MLRGTSLARAASRSFGTVKKRGASPQVSPPATAGASVSSPHVAVFTSVKESLDSLLGEAAQGNDAAPATETAQPPSTRELDSDDALSIGHTGGVTMPAYYHPMNLRETLYEGEVAEWLRAAAVAGRFRSPVWATKGALARLGHTVKDSAVAVNVPTTMQMVELYNLEQTDAPEAVVSASLKGGMNPKQSPNLPLNAAGRPHPLRVRRILQEHPSYRQYTSPYWITEEELPALGTTVLSAQRGCGILIPRSAPAVTPPRPPSSCGQDDGHHEPCEHTPSPVSDFYMLYNAAQLEDPEKVTSETCTPIECVNNNGQRYNIPLTVCMRQYCQKYHLSTEPLVVFVTAARVRSLGGDLRSAGDAVPPFTCVIKDDVVTLYHAEQTTIQEKLVQRAISGRRERLDRITSSSV
ncbi:hypothetical protein DQ04_01311110 [Trypanosoma grayi]|uniref:hypothetical protein n=1 Tax=Trypanosoma grayi TaxID=71804 RepID=UPI0004F46D3E|nr:hypothetical protein DQ04_01311110 [Trypanosoma grayi]KEG12952.1 hypothetical protein DQ04_01311110 [Trypanosoma grayi]